ncbi:hypothetical protein CsSME_00028279 [Camellia sinensis var. sinensis]
MNNIVISYVKLIYCYAECLALHGKDAGGHSVAPAVSLLKKLMFSNEAVQTSSRYMYVLDYSFLLSIFQLLTYFFLFLFLLPRFLSSAWLYLQGCFRFHFQNKLC